MAGSYLAPSSTNMPPRNRPPRPPRRGPRSIHTLTKADLAKLWSLDSIGITEEVDSEFTIDQARAEKMFLSKLEFKDGAYHAPMLWAEPDVTMQDNYQRALKRNKANCLRFNKPGMEAKKAAFNLSVAEFVQAGHAEVMTPEMLAQEPDGPIRYLSVQAVFKDGGDKCRPVFDASERTRDGKSLNNQLLPGPPVMNDLVEVMLRFRARPVAVVGDIRGMFLAIKLSEGKDSHRFLWSSLEDVPKPTVLRLRTVTFGVTDSPYKACKTVREHATTHKAEYPIAYVAIAEDTYVDDTLTGAFTVPQAKQLLKEIMAVLEKGGFTFGKIMSNEPEIMEWVPEELRAKLSRKTLDSSGTEHTMHSALGTSWDPETDKLYFRFAHKFDPITKETKRSLVSQGSMVYDPTGIISPVTLEARKLMRECSDRNMDWNDLLPGDLKGRLANWRDDLVGLAEISIDRCIIPKDVEDIQLHIFSDASATAYGSVVYVRSVNSKKQIQASILMSKNRLAPKDTLAKRIPRLELLGCLLSIRLYKYVKRALRMEFSRVTFWTDSSIALAWIRRAPGSLKPFVGNRVKEIQAHSDISQWNHLPGEYNGPADLCSRGASCGELACHQEWWSGPDLLYWREDEWLTRLPGIPSMTEEQVIELKMEEKLPIVTFTIRDHLTDGWRGLYTSALTQEWQRYNFRREVMERFEGWTKGVRVLATVVRAARIFAGKKPSKHPVPEASKGRVTTHDVTDVVNELVKSVQEERFPKEMEALKNGKKIDKTSKLYDLDPGLNDQGLMVVKGRLAMSKVMEEGSKHPAILPTGDSVTSRAVLRAHESLLHAGTEQTLYITRARFWIMGGRRQVKKILNTCQWCRVRKAEPIKQLMAPLPAERLDMAPPFSSVGCDFAGPVRTYETPDGEPNKSYICLFTCMSTRGCHLELVPSLETQTFVAAFRRMIARRGFPHKVFTDSALTFKKAGKDLKLRCFDLDWQQAMAEMSMGGSQGQGGITWQFNTPRSPWWGGVFERLIGLVKDRLNLGLKSNKLSFLGTTTVLCEIEAIINSRPLACLRPSPEAPVPITPGHLMTGRFLLTVPDASVTNVPEATVLERVRHQQTLTRQFWTAFRRDYILELQRRKKWHECTDLSGIEGQVVVVKEDSVSKKPYWPLGVVTEATKGRDGLVRSCEVRLANGKRLRRPVQKLALIDSYDFKPLEPKDIAPKDPYANPPTP